jgi:serine/threonine protein kinase
VVYRNGGLQGRHGERRSGPSLYCPEIADNFAGKYHILPGITRIDAMTTFEEQLKNALSHAYDIERELGGGGMSRVFVATDKSLGRKVVIKLLSPELTAEVNRGRFRREIQVAAQLQHPHIVTLFSAGEYDDLVYYTMPFIKGESLKSALEHHGPLPVGDVVRILYDVVDALAYAHENGVVHRDITPANILRSGSHALVTDFGVAKALNAAMPSGAMTSTGMAVGTPAYMSPEQLAGDPGADHRIDIYAVGLLAYELLAGKSPFAASSPRGVLAAVLTREPPPLVEVRGDVPRSLSELVMTCLSKEPEGRPESAMALMAALDIFATSSGEIRTREYKVPSTPSRYATSATNAGVTTPVDAPTSGGDAALSGSTAVPGTGTEPGSTDLSGADLSGAALSGSTTVPTGTSPGSLSESMISVATPTEPYQGPTYEPNRPQKSGKKMLVGGAVFVLAIAAAALALTQRSGDVVPSDTAVAVATDSAAADSLAALPVQPGLPDTIPLPTAAIARADSQANADSIKARAARRAARADSLKKAAVVRVDTQQKKTNGSRAERGARWAATAMLSDATARSQFLRGASRKGGVLGAQRRGDLQTQIDALTPFLTQHGLTYPQFKQVVEQSGFKVYDQFGRMVLDSLQRFAESSAN